MPEDTPNPWYQSTLLWGCIGAALTVIFTVLAAMLKDLRWLLALAWPFACVAIWEFVRTLKARHIWTWTALGAILNGSALLLLYWRLTPEGERGHSIPTIVVSWLSAVSGSPWFPWVGGWIIGVCCGAWLISFPLRSHRGHKLDKSNAYITMLQSTFELETAIRVMHDRTKAMDVAYPDALSITYNQRMEFHWSLLRNLILTAKIRLYGIRAPSFNIIEVPTHAVERCILVNYRRLEHKGETHYSSLRLKEEDVTKAVGIVNLEMRIATRGLVTSPPAAPPPAPAPPK